MFARSLKQYNCERNLRRQRKYTQRGFCVTFVNNVKPRWSLAQLHDRCDELFPNEMKFVDMLYEYQHTGILPPNFEETHTSMNRGPARFAQLIGIMNLPQNARFYNQ